MKKIYIVFFALAILAIPSICSAIPPRPGPYFSGFVGGSAPLDVDATSTQYGPGARNFNDRVELDSGFNVGGSAGYDFGFIRIEGELSYKNAEMSSITEKNSQITYANVDGDIGVFAMMCNVFLDLHNPSRVTPYIGGGIGFATLYLGDTSGTDTITGKRTVLYMSDEDTVFAYQFGAGLEIALTPMLSVDLGYRYFATEQATYSRNSSTTTELKFENHFGSIGFRMKF